ncbi:hypothetical protein CFP56_014325 [Quercus suber]|uniref:Leucine-rich repeat-containing N-terminal plant-type domain-containing protein n=1 Tax=Quercus suber TaxID=58331 RepID=A0AAW0KU89_QUESU
MGGSFRLRAVTLTLFLVFLTLAAIDPKFCYGNSEVHCIQSEQQALLRFKQDLTDPLNRLASWLVTGIVVNGWELSATMSNPYWFANMTSLKHLDLSANNFNSSIPNWLYSFSHLEFLNLRQESFARIGIVDFRAKFSLMDLFTKASLSLDISNTNVTDAIPPLFWNMSEMVR